MAEKNAAAFVRNDTFTVDVSFNIIPNDSKQTYRYVCNLPVKEGDLVIVPYSSRSHQGYNPDVPNRWTITRVVKVHNTVEIEPNSDTYYKFVAGVVNLDHYNQTMSENEEIDKAILAAYRDRAKQSFRDNLLYMLPANVQAIANKPVTDHDRVHGNTAQEQ